MKCEVCNKTLFQTALLRNWRTAKQMAAMHLNPVITDIRLSRSIQNMYENTNPKLAAIT